MSEEDRIKGIESIQVPITDFVREVAREAAHAVITEHLATCPIVKTVERVQKLEVRVGTMIGFMVGSGLLGGISGSVINSLLR